MATADCTFRRLSRSIGEEFSMTSARGLESLNRIFFQPFFFGPLTAERWPQYLEYEHSLFDCRHAFGVASLQVRGIDGSFPPAVLIGSDGASSQFGECNRKGRRGAQPKFVQTDLWAGLLFAFGGPLLGPFNSLLFGPWMSDPLAPISRICTSFVRLPAIHLSGA